MKIYIVFEYSYEEHYIGAFSTKEKAVNWIKHYGGKYDEYRIEESILDEE